MRLSLCATSAARFWGLDRKIVTFLHQNVLINKRYIISFSVFGDDQPRFFPFVKTIYPVALVENPSLGKTR
ncbi:hypothetical protein C4J98_1059 [Pseudomonas orientalis]|uniref:hypothetical protein n=1 Tax=Pseudomonas orientalis TaxID=76758 RepID=UPI000F575A24|nr:hypothetical protein [Pseudomonas orientalis]AZE82488.1 hypothetical protein C4J98_1059 [Pseudomonas orientalis]